MLRETLSTIERVTRSCLFLCNFYLTIVTGCQMIVSDDVQKILTITNICVNGTCVCLSYMNEYCKNQIHNIDVETPSSLPSTTHHIRASKAKEKNRHNPFIPFSYSM